MRTTFTNLARECRVAARSMVRAPGVALAAVVALGLGFGASTSVLTVLRGLLLRPPPGVRAPSELVQIGRGHGVEEFDLVSYPLYRELRTLLASTVQVTAYASTTAALRFDAASRSGSVQFIGDDFFRVLGVRLLAGRAPSEAEGAQGLSVAVVHPRALPPGLAPQRAIGQTMFLSGQPFTIIGVVDSNFAGPDPLSPQPDVWVSALARSMLGAQDRYNVNDRHLSWMMMTGRPREGVGVAVVAQAATAAMTQIDRLHPEVAGEGIVVVGGIGTRPGERRRIVATAQLAGALMLIVVMAACASVAGLAFARAESRRGDIAVHYLLGATRTHIVAKLVMENAIIATLAGAAALAVGALLTSQMVRAIPVRLSAHFDAGVPELLLAVAGSALAAIVLGVWPVWSAAGSNATVAITSSNSRGATSRGQRVRSALLLTEIGLAFVLNTVGCQLLAGLWREQHIALGFHTEGVAVATVTIGGTHSPSELLTLEQSVAQRIAGEAGVVAVGMTDALPMADRQSTTVPIADAASLLRGQALPAPVITHITDSAYFTVMGIRLLRGRVFDAATDRSDADPVAIISQRSAERFWRGEDPIGKRLPFAAPGRIAPRVIGVVDDVRSRSPREEPVAEVYFAASGRPSATMSIVVRTNGAVAPLLMRLPQLVGTTGTQVNLVRSALLSDLLRAATEEIRVATLVTALFAGVALGLCALGLYSVLSFAARIREREFAIRSALGATPLRVAWLLSSEAALLAAGGLVIGALVSMAAWPAVASMLGATSSDALTSMSVSALCIVIITLLASTAPSLRTLRLDIAYALSR